MGLLSPKDVGTFTLIKDYEEVGDPLPGNRRKIRGNAQELNINNVIWAEGDRVPSFNNSQKNFKSVFVIVTRDAKNLDNVYVRKVEMLRRQLEAYFPIATKRRAWMDTTLFCGKTISQRGVETIPYNGLSFGVGFDPLGKFYHTLGPIPVKIELGVEINPRFNGTIMIGVY